jgi:hypothetical protein
MVFAASCAKTATIYLKDGKDLRAEIRRSDGERVVGNMDTPTLPGLDHPTFQEIGAYRSNATETYQMYYDGYWMGTSPPPYAR